LKFGEDWDLPGSMHTGWGELLPVLPENPGTTPELGAHVPGIHLPRTRIFLTVVLLTPVAELWTRQV
jgi:hypothetical protein